MNSTIHNPEIPYADALPGSLQQGQIIRLHGTVNSSPVCFAINLQSGVSTAPRGDVALHLSPVFSPPPRLVRNSIQNQQWGPEESHGSYFPFASGQDFEILILTESDHFKIAINGQHFTEFQYRLPLHTVSHLAVDGDVRINTIKFEPSQGIKSPSHESGEGMVMPLGFVDPDMKRSITPPPPSYHSGLTSPSGAPSLPYPGSFGPQPSSTPYGPPQSSNPYGPPQSSNPYGPPPSSNPYGPPPSSNPYGPPQSSNPYGPPPSSNIYGPTSPNTRYGPSPSGYPTSPSRDSNPYGPPPGSGGYPASAQMYPTQPGAYPTQPGAYPSQPGGYPSQGSYAGPYPSQPGHYPGTSVVYPGQEKSKSDSSSFAPFAAGAAALAGAAGAALMGGKHKNKGGKHGHSLNPASALMGGMGGGPAALLSGGMGSLLGGTGKQGHKSGSSPIPIGGVMAGGAAALAGAYMLSKSPMGKMLKPKKMKKHFKHKHKSGWGSFSSSSSDEE